MGVPSGAKMSSPWCQPPETSGRATPNVSPHAVGPYTGNTYLVAPSAGVASTAASEATQATLRTEMLAGEGAKPLARLVVRSERSFVGVLRVARDPLRDGSHLGGQSRVVLRLAQERVHPALGAVVRRNVIVEQKLSEQQAAADVRERAE